MQLSYWYFRLPFLVTVALLLSGCQLFTLMPERPELRPTHPGERDLSELQSPEAEAEFRRDLEELGRVGEKRPSSESEPAVATTTTATPQRERLTASARDRSGRVVRTTFTASRLIRERSVVGGVEKTRLILEGSARIEHNDVVLTAPRIVIDDGRIGTLTGGVTVVDAANGLRLRAARADYDRDRQRVVMNGSPDLFIRREDQSETTIIAARRMIRDLGNEQAIFEGDLRLFHDGWAVLADGGSYRDSDDTVTIDNNPLMLGRGRFVSARQLFYRPGAQHLRLVGSVVFGSIEAEEGAAGDPAAGDFLLSGAATSTGRAATSVAGDVPTLEEFALAGGRRGVAETATATEKADSAAAKRAAAKIGGVEFAPTATIITAHEAEHFGDVPEGFEVRTELRGRVLLRRGGSWLESSYMEALGTNMHTIQSDRGVVMEDAAGGVRFRAGAMRYLTAESLLRLTDEPQVEFFDQQSGAVTTRLTGAVVETNLETEQTVARGNVRIVSDGTVAAGEIADYHRAQGMIVLEGAPYIEEDRSRLESERIFVYPDTGRVLFDQKIRGYMLGSP